MGLRLSSASVFLKSATLLVLAMSTTSCWCEIVGDCDDDDDEAPTCSVPQAERLDGDWSVTSSGISMQTGSYIPIGLDAATMSLQFFVSGPDDNGGCGSVYSVSVPGLDLTSPSNENRPLSLFAAAGGGLPADTFAVNGVYYNTINDITVELNFVPPLITVTQAGFDLACGFSVYSGNQVVSLPDPGEPGEFYDAVNPTAALVSSGTLVLSFAAVP